MTHPLAQKTPSRVEIHTVNGCWQLVVNDAPMRTPAGAALMLPNAALAEALFAEFCARMPEAAPAKKIPHLPLFALACTAQDLIPRERRQLTQEMMKFFSTDTLLCQAEKSSEMAAIQEQEWLPVVSWAEGRYDLSLPISHSFTAPAISANATARLTSVIEALDDWAFAALWSLTRSMASLLLALAVIEHHLAPQRAAALAQLEARTQAARWGSDPVLEAKWAAEIDDCVAAEAFYSLIQVT